MPQINVMTDHPQAHVQQLLDGMNTFGLSPFVLLDALPILTKYTETNAALMQMLPELLALYQEGLALANKHNATIQRLTANAPALAAEGQELLTYLASRTGG